MSVCYQTMCNYSEHSEWETWKIYNELKPPKNDQNKNENIHTKKNIPKDEWYLAYRYPLLKKHPLKFNEAKYMITFIDDCSPKI